MPAYRHRVTSRGLPPGTVSFPFPVRRIIVFSAGEIPDAVAAGNAVGLRDSLVKALAATGCRVAFTEADIVSRNRLAQTSGACGVAPGDTDINVYPRYGDSRHTCIRIPASDGDTGAAVRAVLWSLVEGNDYLLDNTVNIGC